MTRRSGCLKQKDVASVASKVVALTDWGEESSTSSRSRNHLESLTRIPDAVVGVANLGMISLSYSCYHWQGMMSPWSGPWCRCSSIVAG